MSTLKSIGAMDIVKMGQVMACCLLQYGVIHTNTILTTVSEAIYLYFLMGYPILTGQPNITPCVVRWVTQDFCLFYTLHDGV